MRQVKHVSIVVIVTIRLLFLYLLLIVGLVFSTEATQLSAEECNAPAGNRCWYVRSGAPSGGNGQLWSSAWNELGNIGWSSVKAGDVIKVAGGTYNTKIVPTKGGTSESARILIQRATENGYNGAVILPGASITTSYITIDGVDKTQFKFYSPGSDMIYVNIPSSTGSSANADYFELKNITFEGTPDSSSAAKGFELRGPSSMSIQDSILKNSQGHEDIIWWYGSGNLRIERCYISNWLSFCPTPTYSVTACSHSDFVWTNSQGEKLEFRNNLIDDKFPTTLWPSGGRTSQFGWYAMGNNIVFTVNGFNTRDVSNNVFKDTGGIFQGSGKDGKVVNNVFFRTGFLGASGVKLFANNIYAPVVATSTTVGYGCDPIYSLYGPTMRLNDTCTTPANKNIWCSSGVACDPKFKNPESILGDDETPFTDDDGFQIASDSPAKNNGTLVSGLNTDIRGRQYEGAPDIGAYEFRTGSSSPVPNAPSNLRAIP